MLLETPSATSQNIRPSLNVTHGADMPITIMVGPDFDNNRNQVDALKDSRDQDGHHSGLTLDVLDSTSVHHLDHFWEDWLEDNDDYLGLCNNLDIILRSGVTELFDSLASKDLCKRLQSSPGAIWRFSWRGNTSDFTAEILPFQTLTSLKLDCQLSIGDGVYILRQCSELIQCEPRLGDIAPVLTRNARLPGSQGALNRLKISSSVKLRPFFRAAAMCDLREVDLHLPEAGASGEIQEYCLPWEKLSLVRLCCFLSDEDVRVIKQRCPRNTKFYHHNSGVAC